MARLKRTGGVLKRKAGVLGCCCGPPPECPNTCGAVDGESLEFDLSADLMEGCTGFGAGSTDPISIIGSTSNIPLPISGLGWENDSTGLSAIHDYFGVTLDEELIATMACSGPTAYPECIRVLDFYLTGATSGLLYFHTQWDGGSLPAAELANGLVCGGAGTGAQGGSITLHN
jgi:hypothetical protein